MKTKTILTLLYACTFFAACLDDYNTTHPNHGTVTLATDWGQRTGGIDQPASYTVQVGDYSATVGDVTATLDHLFAPGAYRLRTYNTPQRIFVTDNIATVGEDVPASGSTGRFLQPMPGWFFSCVADVEIEADTDHEFTAPMQQQVRQLTLLIEPVGNIRNMIQDVRGHLSGVAGSLDLDTGTHADASNVSLGFSRISTGSNAGKWTATVRLLGIVPGSPQVLTAEIRFVDGAPASIPLVSDLSAGLSAFNTDKMYPLTLDGQLVEVPTEAGFAATINDWNTQSGGSVTVH